MPGWNTKEEDTIKVAKLAQQTGFYPVLEYENGKLVNVKKVSKETPKVDEFFKLQGRFRHLFQDEKGKAELAEIQKMVDEGIVRYGLR